ncbi:FMN-binding protein [Umezawaea sp. Da 62-37]|uniref:FMN-binding protein n=1 Tax=Umezawaea sp. Da 62-37 TaxID=3075927 RepID=UPI0028F6C336|nr:FMN-binding protein [Umezawaea sp. Da 62-37]WNV87106.1 FMN-binding protein [Umezawaea sp. Da 62-37]
MKRIVTWLLSTITVVVLLFGYRTSLAGPLDVVADPSVRSPTDPGTGGSADSRTVTGPSVDTRWGPVQVEVTISGGRVTAVAVPVYPDGNRKDQEINARALPILVQEAIDAQSADVDMVSGATVTSEGYVESLQAALDQAGL